MSGYYTGDKPQAFVGSREWIGAIELGYVLDERLGISAKVITVSSGAEMGSKARELAQHFDSQGTPVMVRLHHTLLSSSLVPIFQATASHYDHMMS